MSDAPVAPPEVFGPELLELARRDRPRPRDQLRGHGPAALAEACQQLRPALRGEFLLLIDHPEQVVPLLADSELVGTIVASGLSEGSWLLEIATPEQRIACLDLDCWDGYELEPARVLAWLDALIEAGRPTLVRALEEVDLEVWLASLRPVAQVCVIGKEEEPPIGWFTEDGVCYFRGASDEDFARLKEIAQASFHEANPLYWRIVYGMLFESPSECEEMALKWRNARLGDLGFPDMDSAMGAWRPLRIEEAPLWDLPAGEEAAPVPVAGAGLPQQLRGSLVAEALSRLAPGRAADLLGYMLAVANALAVSDGLRLSDPDSVPGALEKAVRGLDRGLRELAVARRQQPHEVLETTRPLDLFRIGATLDPTLRRGRRAPPYERDDEEPVLGEEGD